MATLVTIPPNPSLHEVLQMIGRPPAPGLPAPGSHSGNGRALELLRRVVVVADAPWRELGVIPQSGLELAAVYRRFDALQRFALALGEDEGHPLCRCGEVITGKAAPSECPAFATACDPLSTGIGRTPL